MLLAVDDVYQLETASLREVFVRRDQRLQSPFRQMHCRFEVVALFDSLSLTSILIAIVTLLRKAKFRRLLLFHHMFLTVATRHLHLSASMGGTLKQRLEKDKFVKSEVDYENVSYSIIH